MASSFVAITGYAFGITSLIAGVFSLLNPTQDAPAAWRPVEAGNAVAAIAMGIYYPLAAYQENITFFKFTVPMRLLTTSVFWYYDWKVPSVWEGTGAILTLIALMSGPNSAEKKRKN